jgi:hypothetical protein
VLIQARRHLSGTAACDQIILSSENVNPAGDLSGSTLGFAATGFLDLFYLLLNNGAGTTSGTLNGVAEGGLLLIAGREFQVSYKSDFGGPGFTPNGSGNDVALLAVVVPEPGAAYSLLAGLGILLGLRRRERK